MKKIPSLGLSLALTAALAVPAGAQEVQDILAKMIEAQGGRKALESVLTTTAAGTVELVRMGMSGGITMSQKEPDKLRIDIELMGLVITQGCDGIQAWMTDPQTGASQEMPETLGRSMRRQAVGSEALLAPEKAGITYTIKGPEKVGDKDCHVLEQAFADGARVVLLIDASSGLLLRSRASQDPVSGGDVDTETIFEDYRRAGPTMAAHKVTVFQGGIESMRMIFRRIETNAPLDDAFFKMVR